MTPLYSFHESCSPDGLFGEWDVWLEGPHKKQHFLVTCFCGLAGNLALPPLIHVTLSKALPISEPLNLPARVRVRTESNQVHDEEVSVGSEWMMLSSRAPA
jgi:hypothetical protein